MKRTSIAILIFILIGCLLAVGCSKSSSAPHEGYSNLYNSISSNAKTDYGFNDAPSEAISNPENSKNEVLSGRKVIRDAELTVQSTEFDAFITAVLAKTKELEGYIQTNRVNNRGYSYGTGTRYAEMVLRIPADSLDEFLNAVDGLGNVIERNEDLDDVTETYVDMEARLASLRTEYNTLLDLLSKAETLDDIITLQDRLAKVRGDIESYEARIRSYDNLIEYSTVKMHVNEVERETNVEEESFGQEVSRRFRESLEDVGFGFTRFAAWFIGNLPVILIVLVIFIGIPVLIAVLIIKSSRKRKAKQMAKYEKTAAEGK